MDDLISRQAAIDSVRAGVLSTATLYGRTEEGKTARKEIERKIKALPSVSVAEKVCYKDLWNKLYRYLNDMCLGIAPDETTPTDERADRMAQLDILDGILKWMNKEEVARMVEPQETETWNGIHANITAPKGIFERIFNEADDNNDI